jgi:type IX secretion system PorP/SprF family membrane protein
MLHHIKKIIVGFVLLVTSIANAQQDAQYTQYMHNTIVINPAYAGSRNVLSINGTHRSQWQGLEGAPKTQTLSINSPMTEYVGLGLSIVRDEIGPATESYVAGDFSYTLPLNNGSTKFSFGMKAGLHMLNIDFSKLLIYNPTDDLLQNNVNNKISPIIGVGAYVYDEKWYIGISSPNILKTEHFSKSSVSKAAESLHLYAIGGYVFDINPDLQFKPAVLVKMAKGSPLAIDASANFLINKKFTLGASYRLNAAASALMGFQVSRSTMIGYAYDYDTTDIGSYNSGSHEFLLRFEFFTKVKGKVSPRFF